MKEGAVAVLEAMGLKIGRITSPGCFQESSVIN